MSPRISTSHSQPRTVPRHHPHLLSFRHAFLLTSSTSSNLFIIIVSRIFNQNTLTHSLCNLGSQKMSGGVGPTCSDISLPKDETAEAEQHMKLTSDKLTDSNRRPTILSFRQLNALAVIIVLSASGMVGLQDISFLLFSTIYMFFLSKFAFPTLPNTTTSPPIFSNSPHSKLLSLYILFGATIGLFLPILYIFQGIYEGDKQGIKAAAPHVFLLSGQIFMEGLAFSSRFAIPIRVFVPVIYNSMRLFAIMEWLDNEIGKVDVADGGSVRRVLVGRGLALVNLVFWGFNLFGFLLPVYMPRAFRRYYSDVFKVKD